MSHPISGLSLPEFSPLPFRQLFPGRFPARVLLRMAAAASLLHSQASAAVPCSYGENFDFGSNVSGGVSHTGTMTNLDIDREAASVVVTRTSGGNLPAGVTGQVTSGPGVSFSSYSPALTAVASPAYGRGLALTGSQGVPLTFTFSKTMRNLVMHIRNGDNQIFTFTDENDQPLEFVYRFVSDLGAIPQTGTGASSTFFLQQASNVLAVGESAAGSIAFKKSVKVIKMTQTYIGNTRPDLTPANLNTTSSVYQVNFGQYCDQPGVIDYTNKMNFAQWDSFTYSASVDPDTYTGRVINAAGKVVSVVFTGGLQQAGLITWGGSSNAGNPPSGVEEGSTPSPYRPQTDLLYTSETVAAGGTATLTWTFGEAVTNPGLIIRGSTSAIAAGTWRNFKFYKADGVTPLPFLLRDPSSPDRNRQVDANTLFVPGASGSTLQFIGTTTAIVLKGTRPVGTGSFSFDTQSNVFMGGSGTFTASGSTIDSDTDGDGVPDLTDKCPNTPSGAVVGSDGCPLPTDLSVVKTASVTKITPGVPFTYTITVTNTGAEAQNVKASDIVPAGLTINSATASDSGVVTQNGQTLQAVWSIVPNGGTRTLTINVTKP